MQLRAIVTSALALLYAVGGCRRESVSTAVASESTNELTPPLVTPPVADPATKPEAVQLTSATIKMPQPIDVASVAGAVYENVCPGDDFALRVPLGTKVVKHAPLPAPILSHANDVDRWTFSTRNVAAGTHEITIELYDARAKAPRRFVRIALACDAR